jgi:hypothetical protein
MTTTPDAAIETFAGALAHIYKLLGLSYEKLAHRLYGFTVEILAQRYGDREEAVFDYDIDGERLRKYCGGKVRVPLIVAFAIKECLVQELGDARLDPDLKTLEIERIESLFYQWYALSLAVGMIKLCLEMNGVRNAEQIVKTLRSLRPETVMDMSNDMVTSMRKARSKRVA